MKTGKLLPPAYVLTAIVLMVALHLIAPAARLISSPWNLLGIKPFQESSALIMTGVFRLSRNPMYLGFVLVVLGIAVITGSLTPLVVVPAFALLLDRNFIAAEERMLEERFGSVWLEYKKSVRRWI
jgi:protein-S-isoprenylcysteine O-methyltransferase Ste14